MTPDWLPVTLFAVLFAVSIVLGVILFASFGTTPEEDR